MTWLKLAELKTYTCMACLDTGFVPERRLRLVTDRRQRPQDVKTAIGYRQCKHCEKIRAFRQMAEQT